MKLPFSWVLANVNSGVQNVLAIDDYTKNDTVTKAETIQPHDNEDAHLNSCTA